MKKLGFRNFMVFFILSATVAIAYQIPYLRYTFYDQMMTALGLNNTQMGMLATAVNLVSTLSYPIGGILADRFSTRNLFIVTLGSFVILTIAFAFTTNYPVLLVIHALYGFFSIATLWSAYLNGIRSLGNEKNQSTIFGSSEATRGIVQTLCGFLFLGIVGAIASPALGIRTMLLVAAGIIFVLLVLTFIFIPKEDKTADAANGEEEKFSMVDVLKNPGVWITIFLIMGAFMTWSLGNGYLTTYTVQVLKISPSLATTLGIVRSYIIVFVAGFLGGFVMDRFTYKGNGLMIILICIIACVAGVMTTSKVVPLCIGLSLLTAFFANVIKSTYWSVMEQAGIPAKMTAIATGIISFVAFIPDFVVAPICGKWIDKATEAGNVAAGFDKIFILMIVFAIVGIISGFLLVRRTKQIQKVSE